VAKQRNGSIKQNPIKIVGKYAKFSNLDGLSQDDFMFNNDLKPNQNFGNDTSSFTLPSKMNDDLDGDDPF